MHTSLVNRSGARETLIALNLTLKSIVSNNHALEDGTSCLI